MGWLRSWLLFFILFIIDSASYGADSTLVHPGINYKHGLLHSMFFGKHYRKLWATSLKVEVFDIENVEGGLEPVKMGGSNQTTNLRLVNDDGREFMLRMIIKDPTQSLSPGLKKKFWANIIRDQNAAENPYGALIIPPLAEAVGLFHASPRLVYIPYDERLGAYNEKFANTLALFEERPLELYPKSFDLGHPVKINGTSKMLKNVFDNNQYQVDQKLFLKCRLFDMVISDWGRHEDQWRWALYDFEGQLQYKPIPRDRDHAFYLFDDGLITWMASRTFLPKFQSFHKNYKSIKGLNLSAKFLDERFLNELSLNDWLETAMQLQKDLTDTVIENAVKTWPAEVYEVSGPRTIEVLKHRRDKLVKAAYKSYKILSKDALVYGSDSEEVFVVKRISNLETLVMVLRPTGKGEYSDTLYSREFNNKDTRSIRIFGLGGNDVFIVEGDARRGIKVELVGGEGDDAYYDDSFINGIARKTRIADYTNDSKYYPGMETRVIPSKRVSEMVLDRKGYTSKSKKR